VRACGQNLHESGVDARHPERAISTGSANEEVKELTMQSPSTCTAIPYAMTLWLQITTQWQGAIAVIARESGGKLDY
jgi:hypothetical protein